MAHIPFFSIVIPVRDGGADFITCLRALEASLFRDWELIVVDDGSVDGSAAAAAAQGAALLRSPGAGPAHARNLGAEAARGRYLFFLDADCAVHRDTLSRAAEILRADATLDALFGSYDDAPTARNLISQYKNLQHHYVHQTSKKNAGTFWTGCGCVKRDLFLKLGGFDARRYAKPAIEDIEFGYRLKKHGGQIHLAKEVQVKHLKRWTWRSWLRTDITARAVPWSQLLLAQADITADLNLQWGPRISGICAALLLPALCWKRIRPIAALLVIVLLGLNLGFYRFLWQKRGPRFMLACIPLHWLYYFYSTFSFGLVALSQAAARAEA